MNREILFKAKRKDNGEWIEGLPSYGPDGKITELECLKKIPGEDIPEIEYIEIDPETLCQYTGLTDKNARNARKIFERDVVKCVTSGEIGIVKFGLCDAKHYGFYIEWVGNSAFRKDIYYWSKNRLVKIVGNIFDNPEIIQKITEGSD